MHEMSHVEARLREYARAQWIFGGAIAVGMFIIIVVLTFSLLQAHRAAQVREDLVQDNCRNIAAIRTYFGDLDTALTQSIRSAPPSVNLNLVRELVDQAREARLAMAVTHCPQGE
jgi:hypothetical protein